MRVCFRPAIWAACALVAIAAATGPAGAANGPKIGVNVLLNTAVSDAIVTELEAYGKVLNRFEEIHSVSMRARAADLPAIRALPFVEAANRDAERKGAPIDTVFVEDFANGRNTWDLDAINVTDFLPGRTIAYDGSGVYVAVLDSGLLDSWRQYFPEERIATEYARAYQGGGGERARVSEPPNKWEHDQDSHGIHVTSTVLGYSFFGTPINGTAPLATVIPVKVLNQAGWGWSSVIARGILYATELKLGPLAGHPMVINMSLGGPVLDAVEQAAIDYAVANGVIIVAAAGNEGTTGMSYPGAYEPVISAAASGWTGEWFPNGFRGWWIARDVADPTDPDDFYITTFSSRALPGQDLDVAAPGSWVVGPYQVNSGQISYFFLGGTSMASPHVAGTVALMAQKYPALDAAMAESILETSAVYLPAGCRNVTRPAGNVVVICWGADATGWGLLDSEAAVAATP